LAGQYGSYSNGGGVDWCCSPPSLFRGALSVWACLTLKGAPYILWGRNRHSVEKSLHLNTPSYADRIVAEIERKKALAFRGGSSVYLATTSGNWRLARADTGELVLVGASPDDAVARDVASRVGAYLGYTSLRESRKAAQEGVVPVRPPGGLCLLYLLIPVGMALFPPLMVLFLRHAFFG
jgi:hypothetical protein